MSSRTPRAVLEPERKRADLAVGVAGEIGTAVEILVAAETTGTYAEVVQATARWQDERIDPQHQASDPALVV